MYSRRFYGGERTQRNRPSQALAMPSERTVPTEKKVERSTDEPVARMALNIPLTEEGLISPKEYFNPRDFLPEANEISFYDSISENTADTDNASPSNVSDEISAENKAAESIIEVSVYPEKSSEAPDTPDNTDDMQSSDDNDNTQTEGTSLSVKSMTFEDMMLTGLLMLGSTEDYDDEIMLILGLILMIGT